MAAPVQRGDTESNTHQDFQVVDRIIAMRRGKKVTDDIDPKKTTIEEVEKVITSMSECMLQGAGK